MDEVFREENRIGIINWQKAFSPKNDAKHLSTGTEYVLVYAKDIAKSKTGLLPRDEKSDRFFGNIDNDPLGDWSGKDPTARESMWQRLIDRNDGQARRPLIIVYDEAHNLSEQQTDILHELQPEAWLLASATIKLPTKFHNLVIQPTKSWVVRCSHEQAAFKDLGALKDGVPDPDAWMVDTTTDPGRHDQLLPGLPGLEGQQGFCYRYKRQAPLVRGPVAQDVRYRRRG